MFKMKLFILLSFITTISCDDKYRETLLIKPLEDGMVMAHFEFTTTWERDIREINFARDHSLFPMSMAKFISKHEIQEIHFSLTKGMWKHSRWGYPLRDSSPGAELWLWFQPFKRDPVKGWKQVTNLLSGQFCASLNFIDAAASVQPKYSLRPEGHADIDNMKNESVFYAALPTETVCTENLTPWKKLLPCFAKSGLATLLSAVHVFNSNYFSLALDIRPVCRDASCKLTSMEMEQSLTVVFNPPAMFEGKQSWSLHKLFGSSFKSNCPFVSSADIYVDISRNDSSNPYSLSPAPTRTLEEVLSDGNTKKLAVYDLALISNLHNNSIQQLNIASQYKKEHLHSRVDAPPLSVTRSVTGYGVSKGGILCKIENKMKKPIEVMIMEVIPWYFRIYLHTLLIRTRNQNIKPRHLYYRPAKDRMQPHHLEYFLELPANSVTEITFEFDRAHLRWNEYPPDANHGVYIPSGIISVILDPTNNMTTIPRGTSTHDLENKNNLIRIHSQCLLVSLPTPDFSMPYNVICLVSTVISLAFGPLHKLTTMVPSETDAEDEKVENLSLFQRIVRRFKKEKLEQNKAKGEKKE